VDPLNRTVVVLQYFKDHRSHNQIPDAKHERNLCVMCDVVVATAHRRPEAKNCRRIHYNLFGVTYRFALPSTTLTSLSFRVIDPRMSSSQRLSLKASSDAATREAMTQRRQEWTSRIRKDKKNQILAMKRRYIPPVSPTNEVAMETSSSLVDLANRTVENPSLYLANFQAVLSTNCTAHNDEGVQGNNLNDPTLKPEDLTDPLQLVNVLANILVDTTSPATLKLAAAQALTNLAAIETTPINDNYYGRLPESWSTILVESNVLTSLQHVLTSVPVNNDLVLQCCWALGNLVSDSPAAHAASLPLVPTLVQTLNYGLQQKQPSLCRNVAWTISNLVRGGGTEGTFCGPDLLTPSLLAQLLVTPEQLTSSSSSSEDVSWMDVAREAAWILAFLTAKEDSMVNFLCVESQHGLFSSHPAVLVMEAMAARLHQALQQARQASTWSSNEASQALKMTIPCLRSIGNIASSCQGKHLPNLLRAHSKSIAKSLSKLLELGTFPSSSSHNQLGTASIEAAWAARTLLCDAGLTDHESTDIAIPVLLPELCKCVTSGYAIQELKREALLAIWTAVAAPPHTDQTMGAIWSTRSTLDEFLRLISRTPLLIPTLVDFLKTSTDTDIVVTALQLINAMLRRLQDDESLRRQFEEHGGVNALEHICDVASSNSHYGGGTDWNDDDNDNPAADIAADLIDDLFGAAQQEEDEMMDIAPASDGATFTFGVPPVANTGMMLPSRGRGRPVPSWMSSGT
jgi:hypothetical protein